MDFQPFVYGLVDPLDPGHVRYVGMAGVRASRPYFHSRWANRPNVKKTWLVNWVRKLHAAGREYEVLTLEKLAVGTPATFVGFVEKCYIKSLREIGHRLTNVAEGGVGVTVLSPEYRAALSARQVGNTWALGLVHSERTKRQRSESRKRYFEEHPEAREEISKRNIGNKYGLGRHHTEETKQQISNKQKGVPRKKGFKIPPDVLERRAEALKRYNADPANQDKIADQQRRQRETLLAKGFHHTEEAKREMSLTRKGRKHTEAAKAKMSEAKRAGWVRRKAAKKEEDI